MDTVLLLADGRLFRGRGFGRSGTVVGEVVFNTSMTGYQEILTDPSYRGQIVVLTQPHIGTYGVSPDDVESRDGRVRAEGLIVRELSEHYSNGGATNSLGAWAKEQGLAGLGDVDTRALTRHLRDRGATVGALAPGGVPIEELRAAIAAWGSMEGRSLLDEVSTREPYVVRPKGEPRFRVAAWDYGAKSGIFQQMTRLGLEVHVFPWNAPAEALRDTRPHGYFLSNGPGDPAASPLPVENVRRVLGERPLWGICLGHQILALALGAKTYKLPFGHHGGNHPVQELATGRIEITAQNHGFSVDEASLAEVGALATHVSLNDRSVEGLAVPKLRAASVQYHPEAGPGPHDARHLFDRFVRTMEAAT